jgi:NAD(P)-dependent dehydrogenase (short-subunit alcohol dehydrogenase family)
VKAIAKPIIIGSALAVGAGLTAGLGVTLALGAALWRGRRARRYDLRGKNVLITGGSRGLGLALARQFLRRGAFVVLLARDRDGLQNAKRRFASENVLIAPCDVTDKKQVLRTIEDLGDQLGRIDVLVNNAGVMAVGPASAMTLDDFRESMDVHFWGPLYTSFAVLPLMRKRGEGRIVNISSIGGKISLPHLLPYSAGKFALGGFSEGLAAEARKDNIFVTTVYPGLMRSGSPRNALFKGKHRAEFAWFSISASLPLISIGADRAARQIVKACERGDARLVISPPAKLAVQLHEMFPEKSATVLAAVDRLLPKSGGIGARSAKGAESTSAISPSWLTALDSVAARRNNEIA